LKVRVQFCKMGCMKFIGHLDVMRYFQKAVKRAGIDIAYSEGYNPHQKMSFASPLGIGLTSIGEYMDIEIKSFIPSKEAVNRLNAEMVDGISVTEFKYLPDSAKNAMSSIEAAEYYVAEKNEYIDQLLPPLSDFQQLCENFFSQEEIIVTKETKKGETTFDLKPYVFDWEVALLPIDHKTLLSLIVKAGSETNIKPEFVLSQILKFGNITADLSKYHYHRVDLYTMINDEYISLGDIGKNANQEADFN